MKLNPLKLNPLLNPIVVGLGIGAVHLATTVVRAIRNIDLEGKVVVITGASRGLGLVWARQFVKEKAILALVARDESELNIARVELAQDGAQVEYFVCDVRDNAAVDATVNSISERFGRIDVLVNNAGVIEVGPMDSMTVDDFKTAMDTHFWGALYMMLAVMPQMRERQAGRIVNISSIGGKIAVPHLVPYAASKFALVGVSEGLRSELLKDNVYVTTVCPGLMRTGSHIRATFKSQNEKEYAWFSILGSMPILSSSARSAAKEIVDACKHGDAELVISYPAQAALQFKAVSADAMSEALGAVNRVLPRLGGIGTHSKLGKDSQSKLSPSILTILSDQASERNNENIGFA